MRTYNAFTAVTDNDVLKMDPGQRYSLVKAHVASGYCIGLRGANYAWKRTSAPDMSWPAVSLALVFFHV